MPGKNEDLHGNVPDKAAVALLLIDVINDLEFPEGDQLLRHALPMADRIAELVRRARRGRRAGDLRQRQLRPLAVEFPLPGRALPGGRGPGPAPGREAPARAGGLLRPQAEALRLLLDHARHPARIPPGRDA